MKYGLSSFLLSFLLSVVAINASAQNINPASGEVFTNDVVPRVDITINPDSLLWLLADENLESNLLITANFRFRNESIDELVENVGFRLRGNTSRSADKKSFKVDFNSFEAGRKFYGLEKMNLNGQHNDPSISRAKICSDIGTALDIPMMRTNHVRLFINEEFRGVYLNVEHVDEEFAGARFGNETGSLYKCLYPADLAYKGPNAASYKEVIFGRRAYDLQSNKIIQDYEDFAEFVDVLNNTTDADFQCEIEEVFNVDRYLRCIVFDILTGNWDGPIYNQNNFYLYHNDDTGLFEYIPFDVDNTLGIDWLNRDWAERNIYTWSKTGSDRPIYTQFLKNEVYRERFTYYMKKALAEIFNEGVLFEYLDQMRSLITTYVEDDIYYSADYGFDMDDFYEAFEFGDLPYQQTDYNLKAFISTRYQFAEDQLENSNISPIVTDFYHNNAEYNENLEIRATVIDDIAISTVKLLYNINGGSEISFDMKDDGLSADFLAGDGIYGVILDPLFVSVQLNMRISASDINGQESKAPSCNTIELYMDGPDISLSINEILAKNNTINSDEFGQFDDWIELYNYGSIPIVLSDKYLSDDPEKPSKWKLPNKIILPDEFVLVWADNDNEEGIYHSNFKLSASGGFVGLYVETNDGFVVIDDLYYDLQVEDTAWARLPNGTGDFTSNIPTPNTYNDFVAIKNNQLTKLQITPNPSQEQITISQFSPGVFNIVIKNIQGKEIYRLTLQESIQVDISELPSGIYFCSFTDNLGRLISQKFVKI